MSKIFDWGKLTKEVTCCVKESSVLALEHVTVWSFTVTTMRKAEGFDCNNQVDVYKTCFIAAESTRMRIPYIRRSHICLLRLQGVCLM